MDDPKFDVTAHVKAARGYLNMAIGWLDEMQAILDGDLVAWAAVHDRAGMARGQAAAAADLLSMIQSLTKPPIRGTDELRG
jgi:hypothetical protein